MPLEDSRPRREGRTWRRAAAGLTLGALAAKGVANVYDLRVRERRRRLPGLRAPLHVVHVSDLHFGLWLRHGSVRRWVARIVALRPDLILITGDFVQGRRTLDARPLRTLLAPLRAPLGAWGVWGNHDHAHAGDGPKRLARTLHGAGVRVLVNEGVRLRPDLFLAGVDDEATGPADVGAALRHAPRDGATVLMAHQPSTANGVPPWVDLVLSGHTHGGQVRPPVLADWIPYGWWRERPLTHVTSGLGVGLIPLRGGCPPELVSLRLAPSRWPARRSDGR